MNNLCFNGQMSVLFYMYHHSTVLSTVLSTPLSIMLASLTPLTSLTSLTSLTLLGATEELFELPPLPLLPSLPLLLPPDLLLLLLVLPLLRKVLPIILLADFNAVETFFVGSVEIRIAY